MDWLDSKTHHIMGSSLLSLAEDFLKIQQARFQLNTVKPSTQNHPVWGQFCYLAVYFSTFLWIAGQVLRYFHDNNSRVWGLSSQELAFLAVQETTAPSLCMHYISLLYNNQTREEEEKSFVKFKLDRDNTFSSESSLNRPESKAAKTCGVNKECSQSHGRYSIQYVPVFTA